MGGADKKEKGADDEIPELETNFEEVTNKVDWKSWLFLSARFLREKKTQTTKLI